MADQQSKGVVLVVGAGDATGGSIAKRFALQGYEAVITRRNEDKLREITDEIRAAGGVVHPFGVDARREEEMVPFIKRIEDQIGAIEIAVYNVGGNVRFGIAETTSRVFFKVWEMCCFGGFLMGREVSNHMRTRGRGTIIFTGATASVRGGEGYSAFATGKHGLRALAQSMARELAPKGIHIGHVIIDGAIDTEWIREMFPDRYAQKDQDGILNPDSIADAYWSLHQQPRDAWTFEMDLRPWIEKW
ncbi:MAG: SDR family oxidoreductase [Rhodospirillaceae bacterium]|jgi:NAD(P)-dependent dehydrogenase (short-subunit alcohol dehydrogenase family)|nr:SDR family oxidoreductase [Rhodospirillaceae bacterium]MBT7732314.1 SDR family oxidoreductase [Rhodospirillaceae bacterium]